MNTPTTRASTPLQERHERAAIEAVERRGRVHAAADRPGAAVGTAGMRAGAGLEWLPYGPPREHGDPIRLVASYGPVEPEYATIRRGAGLLDAAHRGTLVATGDERVDFLNRMVTQQLADLQPGAARPAFWLNRKGRIDADLLIASPAAEGDPAIDLGLTIDVDRHVAASTAAALSKFIFSEAVEISDRTEARHRLALHGRTALAALASVAGSALATLEDRQAARTVIAGAAVTLIRRDQCGEPGIEIDVPIESVEVVWDALRAVDGVVPIGWHAYNIARIESGTPLYNVDFGPNSLPHETGVLRDRVSFTKGCYLGQEVVARMESLGKPKQVLVGLRIEGGHAAEVLPEAESNVCVPDGDAADPAEVGIGPVVGAVTSSTLSPMLGAAPIAMAMVRSAHATVGQRLLVFGDGARAFATVGPLRAWGAADGTAGGAIGGGNGP